MNSISVNLHNYCNNFTNLHIFNLTDVSDFGDWMCKIHTFFYFALINANAFFFYIRDANALICGFFFERQKNKIK